MLNKINDIPRRISQDEEMRSSQLWMKLDESNSQSVLIYRSFSSCELLLSGKDDARSDSLNYTKKNDEWWIGEAETTIKTVRKREFNIKSTMETLKCVCVWQRGTDYLEALIERGEIEGSQTATLEQPLKRMNEKGFDRETRRKRERED